MSDIELVVKIDEKLYNKMKTYQGLDDTYVAVKHGTPLPRGHGALKDFEKLYADMSEREELARQRVIDTPTDSPCYMRYVAQLNERTAFKEMLFDAQTIIEADKESEGENEIQGV